MNIILERNKKLEALFEKIEQALTENFEVINNMLVLKIRKEEEE